MNKHPYIEEYLIPNMDLHRLVFVMFGNSTKYDALDMIDVYMQTSEIRAKQDIGNWSALNKGSKQVYNSADFTKCNAKTSEVDNIFLHWAADIYVMFQWMYNIPSKEINKRVSARELWSIYNPLHEISVKSACEKIYHKYWG